MKTLQTQYLNCLGVNNLLAAFVLDELNLIHSRLVVKLRILLLVMFLLGLLAGLFMR